GGSAASSASSARVSRLLRNSSGAEGKWIPSFLAAVIGFIFCSGLEVIRAVSPADTLAECQSMPSGSESCPVSPQRSAYAPGESDIACPRSEERRVGRQ